MTAEPRWVPRLVIEAVHLDQLREHGGTLGIRDEEGFESALAEPKRRRSAEPRADLVELAAAYASGICANRPFRAGNKRIAFLAAVVFLELNGRHVSAPADQVAAQLRALASGELDESAIAAWFGSSSVARPAC